MEITPSAAALNTFLQFLRSDLCQNFQTKIRDANIKKIRSCLQDGISHLHQARNNFAKAAQKLDVQQKSAFLSNRWTAFRDCAEAQERMPRRTERQRSPPSARRVCGYIETTRKQQQFKEYLTGEIEASGMAIDGIWKHASPPSIQVIHR